MFFRPKDRFTPNFSPTLHQSFIKSFKNLFYTLGIIILKECTLMKIKSLIVITSSLFMFGCGGGEGGLNDIFDDGATTATVRINNTTTIDVYQLYFKDVASSSWGNDMITSDQYIKNNSKVDFVTTLCDRMIDVNAKGILGSSEWLIPDVYVECGETVTVTLTAN